jgi:hypothetical protein
LCREFGPEKTNQQARSSVSTATPPSFSHERRQRFFVQFERQRTFWLAHQLTRACDNLLCTDPSVWWIVSCQRSLKLLNAAQTSGVGKLGFVFEVASKKSSHGKLLYRSARGSGIRGSTCVDSRGIKVSSMSFNTGQRHGHGHGPGATPTPTQAKAAARALVKARAIEAVRNARNPRAGKTNTSNH